MVQYINFQTISNLQVQIIFIKSKGPITQYCCVPQSVSLFLRIFQLGFSLILTRTNMRRLPKDCSGTALAVFEGGLTVLQPAVLA